MQYSKHHSLVVIIALTFFSCEKKIKLDIKDQAVKYPVIFGIVTNDVDNNFVTVSTSENYSNSGSPENVMANLEILSSGRREAFIKSGVNSYKLNTALTPYQEYTFNCTMGSVLHSYKTLVANAVTIDSIYCIKQTDNSYNVTASFYSYDYFFSSLTQLYVGKINAGSADTTWEKYNDHYPGASSKIDFFRPNIILPDSMGACSTVILSNGFFTKNDVLKIEVFVIDQNTANYIELLNKNNNNLYDPLSIAPPFNHFAFSNKALGIIIAAMKSKAITKIE